MIKKPISQSVQWPGRRFAYAATHITGSLFVMIGGAHGRGSVLSDMWFCDTTTNQWKKVISRTVTYLEWVDSHYTIAITRDIINS